MLPLQASPAPSTPTAGDIAHTLTTSMAGPLVHVLMIVGPVVFGLLALFWAINFVAVKTVPGIRKAGGIGAAFENHHREQEQFRRHHEKWKRWERRSEAAGNVHATDSGRLYYIDDNGRRRFEPRDPHGFGE